MSRGVHFLVALSILALTAPAAKAVISRGDPVSGFATFYGGPQVGHHNVDTKADRSSGKEAKISYAICHCQVGAKLERNEVLTKESRMPLQSFIQRAGQDKEPMH